MAGSLKWRIERYHSNVRGRRIASMACTYLCLLGAGFYMNAGRACLATYRVLCCWSTFPAPAARDVIVRVTAVPLAISTPYLSATDFHINIMNVWEGVPHMPSALPSGDRRGQPATCLEKGVGNLGSSCICQPLLCTLLFHCTSAALCGCSGGRPSGCARRGRRGLKDSSALSSWRLKRTIALAA